MMERSLAYDRAITIFSPEGRLYQVEYALEAVRRGKTAIGIKAANGAVIGVHKEATSPLMDLDQIQKIYTIDKHIGCAIAGLHADARVLVDFARVQSQINQITYGEPIDVEVLTKKVCDLKQNYTQVGGIRPFGVSLLIGGADSQGPQIFTTDPSGSYWSWRATAIGYNSEAAREFLAKNYKPTIKLMPAAVKLCVDTLRHVVEEKLDEEAMEISIVDTEKREFTSLSKEEIRTVLE
jgi:proteasome alpha subunit